MPIVGKLFHELDEDGRAERQGWILAEPYPQVFATQNFEWMAVSPTSGVSLVSLDNILQGRWRFYSSVEEMREAYEYGGWARQL
jgi:hypothetical protein